MDSKTRRGILMLPPIKPKMTYYLNGDNISTTETHSYNDMIDDILEQIKLVIDKNDGLYPYNKIKVDVRVSLKRP